VSVFSLTPLRCSVGVGLKASEGWALSSLESTPVKCLALPRQAAAAAAMSAISLLRVQCKTPTLLCASVACLHGMVRDAAYNRH